MIIFLLYIFTTEQRNVCIEAEYTELEIIIDGLPNESIWHKVNWYSDFTQMRPQYKEKSINKTEFAVVYSKNSIYICAKCHYNDKPVAKTLKRDDYDPSEDGIIILIDPTYDRMNYYLFGVNYLNTQTDGTGTEMTGDYNWDGFWQSKIVDCDSFYVVEMAIPFKCFAFQYQDTLGFNFIRSQYKNREISYWVETGSQLYTPYLFGKLVIDAKKLLKEKSFFSYPYFTLRYLKEDNITEKEAGGEIFFRLPLKSHNIGFTYNPEYCELEPDADVISLVRGAEVYLSEKRPFFLEGFSLYSWNLFYTRRVSEIFWGSKVFGKFGNTDYSAFIIQTADTYSHFVGVAHGGKLGKQLSYGLSAVGKRQENIQFCGLSTFNYRLIPELVFDITMRINSNDTFLLKDASSLSFGTFYNHPLLKGNINFNYSGAQSFPEYGYYGVSLPYNQYSGTIYLKPRFYFKVIKEYSPSINLSYTTDEKMDRIKESESFSNSLTISPMVQFFLSLSNSFYKFPNYDIHNRLLYVSAILGKKSLLSFGSIYGYQTDNRIVMPFISASTTFRTISASLSFKNKYSWINDNLEEQVRLAILKVRFRPSERIEVRTFLQYSDISKTVTSNYVVKVVPLRYVTIYFAFVDIEDISSELIENTSRRFFLKGVYNFSL